MVANHVLCQLSYTPNKHFRLSIFDFAEQHKSAIKFGKSKTAKVGCGGGI
jgi:hypothetical protein